MQELMIQNPHANSSVGLRPQLSEHIDDSSVPRMAPPGSAATTMPRVMAGVGPKHDDEVRRLLGLLGSL